MVTSHANLHPSSNHRTDRKSPASPTDSLQIDFDDIHIDRGQTYMQQAYEVYHRNRGLLLIACSTFTGSMMMVVVKLMSNMDATVSEEEKAKPHIPPLQLIAVRMMLTYFLCVGWMYYDKVPYPITGPPGVRLWLGLRGGAGFFGLFGAYYGIQYLSLSDSTTIGFLTPFATAALGRLILKEAYSRKEAYAALASFAGVLLIARPSFLFGHPPDLPNLGMPTDMRAHQHGAAGSADHGIAVTMPTSIHEPKSETMRLIAILVQLGGVLGASLAFIAMRRVGNVSHVMHSITYFNGCCLVIATLGSLFMRIAWVMPDLKWALGLGAVALLGFCGQILSTMGFQRETAGRGTLGLYLAIVFSLIFEKVFFHHQPTWLSVVGMVVIITSAVYVAVSKPAAAPTSPKDEEVGLMSMNGDEDEEGDETTLRDSDELMPDSAVEPKYDERLHDRRHEHGGLKDVEVEIDGKA